MRRNCGQNVFIRVIVNWKKKKNCLNNLFALLIFGGGGIVLDERKRSVSLVGCFESEKEAICALDAAPPPPRLSNAARCHGSKVAACGAELPRSHGNGVPPQLPGGVAVSWAPPAETSGTPPEASRLPHALRTHTPTRVQIAGLVVHDDDDDVVALV